MSKFSKPKKLRPGGTIAFTAPASAPERSKLDSAAQYFKNRGYSIEIGKSCTSQEFYFAGPAANRADELHAFFERPEVDAIFCVRGGFGSVTLLPALDFDLIAEHPKLFIGFSDLTILQSALLVKSGIPTGSGPLPAVDFWNDVETTTEKWFWNFLETGKLEIEFDSMPETPRFEETVSGICIPGTLSLFSKLAGTPWAPPVRDSILVLEDVEEPMHKIEGYLTHLIQAGWVNQSAGLLFGDFFPPDKESYPVVPALPELLSRVMRRSRTPWAGGLPYGHIKKRICLPFGTGVSVSFGRSTLLQTTESFFAD